MKRGRDLWDIKHTKFCIKGVPEGEERENRPSQKKFEEIIAENFPNFRIVNQVQEAQSPSQDKPKEEHKIHRNQMDKN